MELFTDNDGMSEREYRHKEELRYLAAQGMVLLENDGTLPFSPELKRIALYGGGARKTVKGGTGSGDVNVRKAVCIEEGLKNAGYIITTERWLDEYDRIYQEAYENWGQRSAEEVRQGAAPMSYLMEKGFVAPETPEIKKEDIEDAKNDIAVYVISRNSGEGKDRHNREGDYQLSQKEKKELLLLTENYKKVVVLLNVGGVIDTDFIRNTEGIGAVLLVSQAGSAGGDAVADILTGKVNPSGHLTDTWAKCYEDYPSSNEFSHNGNLDDVYYREGIYVGYRYFDTQQIEPAYCFGYGKSYTTFRLQDVIVKENMSTIKVVTHVKNTGSRAGREVVQVYYSAPTGRLDKPYQELIGFAKTKLLAAGEVQKIEIHFSIADMASYCEQEEAWILEAGDYVIRAGFNSRETKEVWRFSQQQTVIIEQLRNQFIACEKLGQSSFGKNVGTGCVEKVRKFSNIHGIEKDLYKKITLDDVRYGRNSLDELIDQLSLKELITLCVGRTQEEVSVIGNAGKTVPGAAGETTDKLWDERKIPAIIMADGPAGLRLTKKFWEDKDGNLGGGFDFELPECLSKEMSRALGKTQIKEYVRTHYQYCSALPIETLMAQSWDMDVIERCSSIVAVEMQEYGIHLWLAPGMNIHRNPLGGRNFEYYSEDPLLTGKCASASVRGVQKYEGVGVVIKHLVANNQEENRNYSNSCVGERTLREIYLKGFEICVKDAKPIAIMTSYNLLNGVHTANSYSLLTDVVRGEWGFEGIIMTDWGTTLRFGTNEHKYGEASASKCISAENDLIMPGTQEDKRVLFEAVEKDEESDVLITNLQKCAKRIVETILKLKYGTSNKSEV